MKTLSYSKKLDKLVLSRDRLELDSHIYFVTHDNMRPEDALYEGIRMAEIVESSNVPIYAVQAFKEEGGILFFRGELEDIIKRISQLPKKDSQHGQ
jgi:hypothetical protein